VRYTVVNLYQSTCNQPVTTCTNNLCQHVPYINLYLNLYHKQMHQPCTKPVQITCHNNLSKQPVINLYHKQVHQPCTNLYLNLYHQRVHQPCTKYVPIMHQIHINYDSSRCTNIINYTPHVCANSSTTCLNHVPNMYLNQNPSSISSSKYDL
jgi:hypothetical protein